MRKKLLAAVLLLITGAPLCVGQTLRISVLTRFRAAELELAPSRTEALVVEAAGNRFILEPDSYQATAQITIAGDDLLVAISGRRVRTKTLHATGRTGAADFKLSVPGKVSRRYFGALTIAAKDGKIQTIVAMDLETAVASAVQAETDAGTPLEALKAQAVVTRSYFVAAKNRHRGFDFCDLAHCQVLRSLPDSGSPAARATVETRGLVLAYQNRPFAAMFTGSCGGRTRTPSQDGLPSNVYPYFAVRCNYCREKPFRWTRKLSPSDFALLTNGENGRLALCRRLGWNAVPSDDFTPRREGAQIVLEGKGQGHGIGLCQRGAEAMAAGGAGFAAIIAHYFPNTKILHLKSSSDQLAMRSRTPFAIVSESPTIRPELSDELERYTILAVRLVHFALWLKDGRPHGDPSSRLPVRAEDAAQISRLHRRRRPHPRPRHWCQHRHLQRDPRRPSPPAPV